VIRAQTRLGPLLLGTVPRVVGTVSNPATLDTVSAGDCDIVELRLDLIGADALRPTAVPAIATVRLASEGGQWSGPDAQRWPVFERALRQCAAADIELRSVLLQPVSELACRLGKSLIVSYHDFEKTPPFQQLRQAMIKAANYGNVVKIATRTRTEEDLETLRQLFEENCSAALCVLGMGELAAQARVEFARLGSCLVYGYLDAPVAAGQPSARQLLQQLRRA
jgi:3-dehydroquinate dehydratase-1